MRRSSACASTADARSASNSGRAQARLMPQPALRSSWRRGPSAPPPHRQCPGAGPPPRRGADAPPPPAIPYNSPSTPADQRVAIDSIRLTRRIVGAPALARFSPEEFMPGPQAQSEDELLAAARDTASTVYHPGGTCKMGRDPTAGGGGG